MKKFSRLVALALAAIMTLTACGAETKPSNKNNGEIVDITVMVYDRGHEYTGGHSLTNNKFTQWVNEQMEPQGVRVTYVPVPRSGADDKVNLMLTGGTAPDLIRTYDRQRVATYASQGGLAELSSIVDSLHPDYLEKAEPYLDMCKFDGGLYALPNVYSYTGKSHETYIRQDLVEALGMKTPTNKEELVDFLYAVKEKYPDIIPYGMGGKTTDGKVFNFLLAYVSRANERDNYIYEPTFTMVLKPGHKDGLKQLNQFVLDGIIDPNFVLDIDDAKYEENVANGKYAFILNGSDACIADAYGTVSDPNYHMIEIDVLKNLDGSYEVPSQGAFNFYVYVPATAEDRLEAVGKYIAFLSDPAIAQQVDGGLEGLGYEVVDGKRVGFDRATRIANGTSSNPGDNGFMWGNYPTSLEDLIVEYQKSNPEVPADVAAQKRTVQYSNYYHSALIGGALKSDEYVPNLQTLICEFIFKVMSAPEGKFEEVYAAEYQILLDNHLQEVLDERAEWYDKNIAK
ncbi:MAG: extracellular solute-binding protein [Lachnospiraceae bacterium]|nr:extracellular solute-binding protein [Lachnospiraceae bacterium]